MRNNNTQQVQWSTELLSRAEQIVLSTLFRQHAGAFISPKFSSAVWVTEGLSGAEARVGLIGLRQKGWIKTTRKTWGEHLYYIPNVLLPQLTEVFAIKVGSGNTHDGSEEAQHIGQSHMITRNHIQVLHEAEVDIAAEFLHLMAWIIHDGLPLTSKGMIHKRTLRQLCSITALHESHFRGLHIHDDDQEGYPVHIAIALDLLLRLGLLEKSDTHVYISNERLQAWINRSWSSMYCEIYNICAERYGMSEPYAQHFRSRLLILAPAINEWFPIRSLLPWRDEVQVEEQDLLRCDNANPKSLSPLHLVQSWLRALVGLGFGEVGHDATGEVVYRWLVQPADLCCSGDPIYDEKLDKEKFGLFIQPDFEILLPPEAPPHVRWRLELCAELVTRDRMSIYRLTKESVMKAVRIGFTLDQIVLFLNNHAMTGIPEHVHLALQQWGQVPEDHLAKAPNPSEPTLEASHRADELVINLNVRSQGTINTAETPYEEDDESHVSTELDELWPGYKDIPEMWHREWRKYHASTVRQIASKAIEWQTKLELKRNEDIVYIIPDRIEGHGDWMLSGWVTSSLGENVFERQVLSPRDWGNIRLIVPDHERSAT
ncbi:helicase-associated domain-containing protein [Paenibacillus xylanexedens]|uniref:helicase-associated domain-containing protein n=1 Tax=Paenibacillus xylanexedens TaxID=528191 RepID=UPI0016431E07|nr:helicase-associated domain-containing protein [Paenibacillus xylanexedens]